MRYEDFCPQLENRSFSVYDLSEGLWRFFIGLGKKVLLSDQIGEMIPSLSTNVDTKTAWLMAFAYAMQLYLDFSGYSDMAIGISRIFGFSVAENFSFPYLSTSVTEFWRKWHISLGSWFRTYVYIPLGGNRTGSVYFNLLCVFALTGIWHGNTLVYLYWGLAHGALVLLERTPLYRKWMDKNALTRIIGLLRTNLFVILGWTCFRAGSMQELITYFAILFGQASDTPPTFSFAYYFSTKMIILLFCAVIGAYELKLPVLEKYLQKWEHKPVFYITKYVFALIIAVFSFICITANGYSPFLYFQY